MVKVKKTNKTTILFFILVLTIIFAYSVNAITATLLTGAIYMNVDEVPVVIEKSLGVRNDNNYTVNVFFEPTEDIADIISLEISNLTLEPFEDKFVKFNISLDSHEEYNSNINAIFSRTNVSDEETEDKVGMAIRLVIKQKNPVEEPVEYEIPLNKIIFLYVAIGIVVIAAIIIIILRLTRWKK